VTKLVDVSDREQCFWFTEGLHPDAKFLVKERECRDLTTCIYLVLKFEDTRASTGEEMDRTPKVYVLQTHEIKNFPLNPIL
jgi:hypothetical protein